MFKLLFILLCLFFCVSLTNAQNATFIALDNAGNLYEVNTGTCKSTKLTFCTNFTGNPLSIALDGSTLYIVDNKGWLYKNTLGTAGTTTTCTKIGQFLSKSAFIYGMTVGAGGIVYAASGSLIETYNSTTNAFGTLGSLPSTWTIGGDLLFYKGILYEAVNIGGSTTNNALIQVNLSKPANSTLYMNFNAGTKVFGFASVTVPCANNQAYAVSTGTSTTEIFAVDMTNKTQSTTATCTLNYLVNDAASVAETQSATPPVAPTIISPLNFCQNDPVTSLTATVASNMDTLKWYTVSSGGTSTGKPVPTLSSATLGTIKYYVSDFDTSTKCESTRDSIIVTINPYPAVPTINPLGPDTICTGTTLLLTSSALSSNINQWYQNNIAIGGALGITYSANTAGNYTIKTSTAAGCSKTSVSSNLVITSATISYPGSPFCPVGTKAVTQTGDTGGRYTVTPIGLIIDSITGTINLGTSASGTYTITYTVGPAHCTFTASVTVQAQTAGISYSKPIYCKSDPNQAVIFAAGSLTTGSFSATPAGLSINANGTINPSASTIGKFQVAYTYGTAGVGCGVMSTYDSVSITDIPVVPAIAGLSKVCTGSSITLTNSLPGGVWSSSNTALATVGSSTGDVSAVAQGSVNIIYTVTNGCGPASQSQAITITNGPVTPPITGANSVCTPNTITLSNSISGGTWSTSDANVATVNNSGVVTGVAIGNVTITYSVTNSCGVAAQTHIVAVNAPVTSSSTISICPDALPYSWNGNSYNAAGSYTIHLTSYLGCDSAATLVLKVKPTSTSSSPVSICPSALPYSWNGKSYPAAGTYLVHLTNAVGCDSAATLVLSLNATSASSTPVTICQSALPYSWNGNSYSAAGTYIVHLTNAAGCDSIATLVLSVNTPSVSSTNVTLCPSALPYSWNANSYNAAGTYTIHLTNAVGCDSAATLVLNLNALPVVNPITGGNSVCANNTVQLSSVTTGGVWSSSNTSAATVSNNGQVSGVATGTTIINYSLTNTCGTTTQTMNITVNDLPVVNTISGNNNICVNNTTQLIETTTGGTWNSSNAFVINVNNVGQVTATATGTAVITYAVTNVCGTTTQSFNIIASTAPIVSPITGNDSVCVNATVQLNNSPGAGTWTSSSSTVTVNSTGLVTGVKSGAAIITYSVTNSCGTTTQPFNIYVNDVPLVSDISGTNNICLNATTQLSDISVAGTWTSSNIAIAPVSITGIVTGVTVGTATINYAVKNSCGTTTKTFPITVSAAPTPFPIKGLGSLCTATSTQLTNATTGGVWASNNTAIAAVDNSGNVLGVGAGTTSITYTISNLCGTNVASFPILIHPVPSSALMTSPYVPNICLGDSIVFSDFTTTNPVVTSLWYLGNGVVDTGMFISYTYPLANNYSVTHRIIDQFGCLSTPSKIYVTVHALPTVNNGYTVYVLQNDSITFNPQVTGIDNNSTYLWSPNIFLNNNTILNPVCSPANDITYTLIVKDSIGCYGTDTLHVVVLQLAEIPNVFSPNGDGQHELWNIPYLDKFPGIKLKVFDRGGLVVYTCNDKYVPWNGKYNGKDVPFGVYYYMLDRGFHLPMLSGTITIIR